MDQISFWRALYPPYTHRDIATFAMSGIRFYISEIRIDDMLFFLC